MQSGWRRRIGVGAAALVLVSGTVSGCSSSSEETAFWTWLITDLLPISPGDAEDLVITFSRVGYAGPIDLSVTDLPAGITVTFDSNGVRGAAATGRVSVAASVAPSTYHFTLHGAAAGTPSLTANIAVTVGAPAGYTLSASPALLHLAAGTSGNTTVTVARTAFQGDVFLSAIVPTGITVDFAPSDVTGTSSTATIHAAPSLAPGNYTVTLHGIVSGAPDQTVPVTVMIP